MAFTDRMATGRFGMHAHALLMILVVGIGIVGAAQITNPPLDQIPSSYAPLCTTVNSDGSYSPGESSSCSTNPIRHKLIPVRHRRSVRLLQWPSLRGRFHSLWRVLLWRCGRSVSRGLRLRLGLQRRWRYLHWNL